MYNIHVYIGFVYNKVKYVTVNTNIFDHIRQKKDQWQ